MAVTTNGANSGLETRPYVPMPARHDRSRRLCLLRPLVTRSKSEQRNS
ncbi:MAG: hypothetical protein HOL38_03865 [Verrucomicrobia bacterium]|nr:hypothetical protein [Verrucomicrobiota bacterium]